MMNKRRALILTVAVAGVVAMGAGCGKKVTAESLIESVTKNMEEKKSVEANMLLEFDGGFSAMQDGASFGIDMSMSMDADLQAINDKDNKNSDASYMKGTIKVEMMGANVSMDMENYMVPEDGKMAVYTGTQGQWVREEQDIEDSESLESEMLGMDLKSFIKDGGKVELAKETEKVGDKECYKLTVGVSGDMFSELMDMSSGMMGDALPSDDIDFSEATLDYVMYIDKKEEVPVKIVVDGKDMMNSVIGALEESEVSADISKFDISVEIKGFDTIDEIKVPEDVKAQAIDANAAGGLLDDTLDDTESETEEDLEDESEEETGETDEAGNPVISNYKGIYKAAVAAPEGYEVGYTSDTMIGIDKETDTVIFDANYMFDDYTTTDEMKEQSMQSVIDEYPDEYADYKKSEVMEFDLNGQKVTWFYETYKFMKSPCVNVTAWIAVDEETMFVCELDKFRIDEQPVDVTEEEVRALFAGVTIR